MGSGVVGSLNAVPDGKLRPKEKIKTLIAQVYDTDFISEINKSVKFMLMSKLVHRIVFELSHSYLPVIILHAQKG